MLRASHNDSYHNKPVRVHDRDFPRPAACISTFLNRKYRTTHIEGPCSMRTQGLVGVLLRSHRTNAVSCRRYINYTETVFTCFILANRTKSSGASSRSTNDSSAHMKLVYLCRWPSVASPYRMAEGLLHDGCRRGRSIVELIYAYNYGKSCAG
jgi:hypothetical protein